MYNARYIGGIFNINIQKEYCNIRKHYSLQDRDYHTDKGYLAIGKNIPDPHTVICSTL